MKILKIQQYLDKLRKKPKAVRAQVGFVFAGSITTVLFLIWVTGLPDRMNFVSADPTIAEYQREVEKRENENKTEVSGVEGLFGQIKRGMAAVIFNKSEPVPEEKKLEDKVIDINAMLQNPQSRKSGSEPTTTDSVSEGLDSVGEDGSVSLGSVILIGTTTSSNNAESSD